MHGGFLLDPLPLVTAMVHPVGDVRQFQRPILHLGPSFPPPLDLAALLLVQLARLFPQPLRATPDRKSVVSGKSVSVRVDLGGRRIIKQTTTNNSTLLQT